MAVTNPSLLQEVQRFNEALNTSNTQEIQNKVSDRLFGLFENRPNIVLNEEFLVELEKTGNLASFAIRIPAIKNKLNQTAIPVNTINITNTVVNLANTNTAKSIQDEINAITNTNIKNLDALPNQITRVREKLNKNRENLIDIRNIQQKIDDINTNRGNNTQTVAQINAQMRTTNTQITACKSVRSIFESITQEEANLITASDKQKGNIEGKILKLRNSLATMLTNQGANLPGTLYQTITQNSNNISTCSNELMAAEQKLANDLVQLQDQSGFATNLQTETVNLQTAIGKLNQQQVPIPQNIGLNITHTVINPANITTIANINTNMQGVDKELQEIDNLENTIQQLRERYQKNIDTLNELLPLQKLQESLEKLGFTPGTIDARADEIKQFIDIGQQMLLIRQQGFIREVGQFNIDFGGNTPAINLNNIFIPNNNLPANYRSEYAICNTAGEELQRNGQELDGQIVGGKAVKIKGINIQNVNNINELHINNLQISPLEGVTFPAHLALNVRIRIQDPVTGINLDHFKTLNITINRPIFNQQARQAEVNAINTRGNTIVNSMNANYATLIARLEREAFYRGLEKADGPKFNKLTPEQKETLYQDVRNTYRTPAGNPRTGAQFGRAANLRRMNNFNTGTLSFLEWITGDNHESNKPEFTINPEAYRAYIHNNLEDQIKKYFERRFDEVFSENLEGNTYLKKQLTDFLTDIEHQKVDTNVHQDILGDIDAVDEMENRRRFGIIGRNDVNYLRFFAGQDSKLDIKDQTVNITTNNRPEDLNNPEPVKYDMNMEVSGKQQILVNIKIEKNKEIKLKAGDPAAMVRKILQCEDIQHGKVRAHVVYNLIKGFIDVAKKKDISLTYRDPGTGDMMVIKMDGKNIVLEQQDDHTNAGGTHRRNTTVLFDHQYFENTNTFDSTRGNENRRLRVGIDRMMGHFNFAMNELHYQYRQASERRWMGLRRGETRMTLPTSFWLSPIKKLINLGTTTKFDFSTTAQANGKSVSIEFKKNKFTLNMAGLKKPISSRTLGKLLRHREGGIRSFDGMERDICGKIYEEMIKKMRENSKIARTNFGVKDAITGRTYILDSDGQLGYINAEQAEANPNMIRRGLLSHRDYGVVNNPPEARRMCDESETREVFKNPFLMGRLIKTMNNRMGIISSTRALLN
ncbi:MAG: hypothetical protein NT085_05325 [candidate division SR1 bacterium]|nr:hypothetical protein [candidate division SR1 bacterium]